MSGGRMGMPQMNGNNRRPQNINRIPSIEKPTCAQHDDLIKYIHDSWFKVSQEIDRNSGSSVVYYKEENHNLKNFEPFDLNAYWGQRLVQNEQQTQHS